ncbi:ABC transporter ATP-binding protein [Caballeronia telluris]|uniref:ABC-transporter ATP binding protein n=1 Tax=Caballeronia telluris TaxID=326475 RepID=A0A158G3P5_9BURK|nr:ABC transporter ATP-binding protein [Caballeronia telluris]SAL26497.1 ABC-transporter ATP binding protein [Caballeronia telluris]
MIATLHSVDKTYWLGKIALPALRNISIGIRPDCFTVIAGPSGSGKSTLLNVLGGIDRPDRGEVEIRGQRLGQLDDDALSDFRAAHLGFVFQNFNLLPVLSAYENVEYPLVLARTDAATRRRTTMDLLEQVGLADKARHLPGELSGGQRQRVAIARALIARPQLVLADEPTANLDSHTGDSILALMREMQREHHVSFVFSSHDHRLIEAADDVIEIRDGRIAAVRRHRQAQTSARAEAFA